MDAEKVKDYSATGLGSVTGIDMIYSGIEGMLQDGVDAPEVKLVVYGMIAIVTGFFAWKRNRQAAPVAANP